ncbi:triose-phosphate isomerase [Ameyamaea chiangmaiensis]|uniref:Triosephosphate isomerase n=1 Tax=Ameyamaea chiangmaiensis TaxID=442969 RepID=A0A850PBY4_9PROT|nr:triose-phosphate isomerase [Ameyamaea chiangmaiensis]MBS4075930.1 triose-phosphate isomerase [Ameyamaea chiangmaiensis]NVN40179.1 triose-phosphate isomerase [Ameyamaea chiangmaiensis]
MTNSQARHWIGTSWKMNKTLPEAAEFAKRLLGVDIPGSVQPFVIPPFTALASVATILRDSGVLVGAQTMHWADQGSWTGEISAPMLVDAGAQLVELGHSERRQHFGETDHTVNLKVLSALRHGLIPLICIGEDHDERAWGVARATLERQIRVALLGVRPDEAHRVVLAYEPVWAIGETGRPAPADLVAQTHRDIRRILVDMGTGFAGLRILYGGSVSPDNAPDYLDSPDVGGLFVGRSAWNVDGYQSILRAGAPS